MSNLKEKMLQIMECLKGRSCFKRGTHLSVGYGKDDIKFYYSDDDYFDLIFKGVAVNISGAVKFENIEDIRNFNIDEWVETLFSIVIQKIRLLVGKEYILFSTAGVEEI